MNPAGCIYFIQVGDSGPIKVGFSSNPPTRLTTLQASHFETLHLIGLTPGSRYDEERLHSKLRQHKLGREWYLPAPEVFEEIEEPVARVSDALADAVTAREHLKSAIGLLRASNFESAEGELRCAFEAISRALEKERV